VAKVEAAVEYIRDDMKDLKRDLRVLLGVALGAYVALAASHLLLADKIEKASDRIQAAVARPALPSSPTNAPEKATLESPLGVPWEP
jgi:hypothetical protein